MVNRSTFIRNLKTELSVATVKGNAVVFQACISQLAQRRVRLSKRDNLPSCFVENTMAESLISAWDM